MLTVAKSSRTILIKSLRVKKGLENIWRGNVIQIITNNAPLNIFQIILDFQVTVKSSKYPDDNFKSKLLLSINGLTL